MNVLKNRTSLNFLFYGILTAVIFALSFGIAEAQGLNRVNTAFNTLEMALRGISISVITVAFIFVGYKVLYKKEHLGDFVYVIIGAIIIASAAEGAKLLIG